MVPTEQIQMEQKTKTKNTPEFQTTQKNLSIHALHMHLITL